MPSLVPGTRHRLNGPGAPRTLLRRPRIRLTRWYFIGSLAVFLGAPTLARRFPVGPGTRPYERVPPLARSKSFNSGPPPFRGKTEGSTATRPTQSPWKLRQYSEGVGPTCPWYFEPNPDDPYGFSAGVVIARND